MPLKPETNSFSPAPIRKWSGRGLSSLSPFRGGLGRGLLLLLFLTACSNAHDFTTPIVHGSYPATATLAPTSSPTALPTLTAQPALPTDTLLPVPSATFTLSVPTATPDSRLPPEAWQQWPVIPVVSAHARTIYQAGIAAGNSPNAFSRVGDCQNVIEFFLGPFDNPKMYRLGPYTDLQPVIAAFKGSYGRKNITVKGGFNVASVLNPTYSDPVQCKPNETPLACEFRLQKPAFAIISMETWWGQKPNENYEKYLRQIVDFTIAHNVVPILATKADNLEGDNSINLRIARVAYEYDLPVWNFWAAVQSIPDKGLWDDGFHLTNNPDHQFFFDDPAGLRTGVAIRNLTALQALNAVWRGVTQP
jgi:hypothetical protein